MGSLIVRFYLSLFFGRRFYLLGILVILVFVFSYALEFLFNIGLLALLFFAGATLMDYIFLFFRRNPIQAKRELSHRFSNNDKNKVTITVSSYFPFTIRITILDELPRQFQMRNFSLKASMKPGTTTALEYSLRPVERGEYHFYNINVLIKSPLGLIVRRKIIPAETVVKVLPSYFQLRQFELLAYSNQLADGGNKKIRKLGHSLEFEQIKDYVSGDDIRSINWKATGRRGGQLMVNNYTDEKSQQVYCLIDMGRVMKMPFEGLTLLDYAINATLILSRVALIKQDKAGLITFSDQIGSFLPAGQKELQMNTILETLYNQKTRFLETDFEKLYSLIRTRVTQRSLFILFTNFESISALKRQLPYIRSIARKHLVLLVFFENTELRQLTDAEANDIEALYIKTIANKFAYEKRMMVKELQQHGIASILTAPQNLTVNAVNKYLEIKSRQAI